MTTFEHVCNKKIITIIRDLKDLQVYKTVEALYDGGIHLAEVTFNQNLSPKVTADIIQTLNKDFKDKMIFGAGTVITMEQLYAAYDAGAAFLSLLTPIHLLSGKPKEWDFYQCQVRLPRLRLSIVIELVLTL